MKIDWIFNPKLVPKKGFPNQLQNHQKKKKCLNKKLTKNNKKMTMKNSQKKM